MHKKLELERCYFHQCQVYFFPNRNPWPFLQSSNGDFKSQSDANFESSPKHNIATEEPVITKNPVSVRRSRVMHREEPTKRHFRVVNKPLLKSGDTEYDSYVSTLLSFLHTKTKRGYNLLYFICSIFYSFFYYR